MTTAAHGPHDDLPPRGSRAFYLVTAGLACLATATLVAALLVERLSGGRVSLIVFGIGAELLNGLAFLLLFVLLAVVSFSFVTAGWSLLFTVLLRILSVLAIPMAGLWLLLYSDSTVTPILGEGCDTGYVVQERTVLRAGFGTVYLLDGVLARRITETRVDDGKPFASGEYSAEVLHGRWAVLYAFKPGRQPDQDLWLPMIRECR